MEWKTIDSAPKDKRVMLYRPTALDWGRMVFGRLDDDKYAKNPRPYWSHDLERILGVTEARINQPTHWALPDDPQ